MGLFLQTFLFPGGKESRCRTAVRVAAEDPEMNIQPDSCRWHLYKNGLAVLMNDGCIGYEALAEKLSTYLPSPVMVLFIYDEDYWGYFLCENGVVIDQFHACPEYFGPGEMPGKTGNADLIAQIFGVERITVEEYLIPWEEEKIGRRAYESDDTVIGDCWQMADFMDALGFKYDLLCPPEQIPDGTSDKQEADPIPTPAQNQYFLSGNMSLDRDEPDLPNSLTDMEYVLFRAKEVSDSAQEAVQSVQDMQFESAVPLLTSAIQKHPDSAALYILRAFCWNQLERNHYGRSRKPDMDRDMTKVLELEPDNIMALRARCPTTGTTIRYKRHIEDLTRLNELDPEHWDNYLTSRAYRYHWVGDDVSAKADLRELVRRGARLTVDLRYLLEEFGMCKDTN